MVRPKSISHNIKTNQYGISPVVGDNCLTWQLVLAPTIVICNWGVQIYIYVYVYERIEMNYRMHGKVVWHLSSKWDDSNSSLTYSEELLTL